MSVIAELVVARHGEAYCNLAGVAGGERGCTGLTELGQRQARRLAVRLKTEHATTPYDHLYANPRPRVRQTADRVAAELGLAAVIEDDLRGPDFGEGDGRPWADIRTAFGGPPRHDPERPFAPGSESWNQHLRRASGALARLLERHAGQRIIVVGHQETIEATHLLMFGLPAETMSRLAFRVDNAALSRWRHHATETGYVWQLVAHNDTTHLNRAPA